MLPLQRSRSKEPTEKQRLQRRQQQELEALERDKQSACKPKAAPLPPLLVCLVLLVDASHIAACRALVPSSLPLDPSPLGLLPVLRRCLPSPHGEHLTSPLVFPATRPPDPRAVLPSFLLTLVLPQPHPHSPRPPRLLTPLSNNKSTHSVRLFCLFLSPLHLSP